MLQVILKKISNYYESGNRWWLPIVSGLLFSLSLPPFNNMLHPVFSPFPLLVFVALVPFFFFATRKPRKRALIHSYIYCVFMAFGQYYWIGFVTAEGLWALILVGVLLISMAVGVFYFAAAVLFRLTRRFLPRLYILVFPAVWVLVEYSRTVSDISFPWSLLGYSTVGILPLAQFSAFTGVWGLSFLIVLANILLWELLLSLRLKENVQQKWIHCCVLGALVVGIMGWGIFRMDKDLHSEGEMKVSLLQSHMDQFNWARNSIDTAFTVSEQMVDEAAVEEPDLMIFPESALLCYLDRRVRYRREVISWVKKTGIPLIAGGLHWDKAPEDSPYEYDVYNSAFLVKPHGLESYHKVMLVPFSERMPFEAQFPILSRVNLGEADFKSGKEESVFDIGKDIHAAPYICYEIIYPSFVQRRLDESTNLLINVTNDGWFGRTSGPYQHAAMAQMRSIENGISLARSANSGISMTVDPFGRILSRSGLYERAILTGKVPRARIHTFYSQHGDWFITVCAVLVLIGALVAIIFRKKPDGVITRPLLVEEQKLAPNQLG
ncbi:MAG: apolipoprotein N-acyltransferase [Chitinispirillaceae bacterium]